MVRDGLVFKDEDGQVIFNQYSFCELVKHLLVELVGISYEEASQIVERSPLAEPVADAMGVAIFSHDLPYYWAMFFYYGNGYWWEKGIPAQPEDMDAYEAGTLGNSLDQGTFADLQNVLGQMPSFIKEHANFFTAEGQLLPQTKVDAFLQEVSVFLEQNAGRLSKESVQDLLRSKGYQKLFSDLVTKEWTVAPQDLPKEHSISHLYEKMSQQIHDLEQLADKFPSAKETIQGTANSLSQNIEFMNQLSQMYSYVQVPIRLRGQNVNSELFVYRNGGRDKGADDELTAFLHFDMDNLGGVDISVKMLQKNVSANWYLEDADSLTLLEENMHLLTERLEKKGYTCSMKLEQDAKKIDFVEDFLKADQKSSGEVHRYSFDVRA